MAFKPAEHRKRTDDALPDLARKGRGSVSNHLSNRFDLPDRYEIDDGWSDQDREDWAKARRQTILGLDTARRIITYNKSPDIGFDRSINPYRGCEHGCIYCFARPSHAYLDLSPGLDFETRIFRKPDAAQLLRQELSEKSYRPAPVILGINTDAYQPTERSERITRGLLEVLYEFRHPVHLITKSALIQRDLDLLTPMAVLRLVSVTLSITTLDRELARTMEPRAATPQRRIDTVRALSAAGVPVNVLNAPIIPGLTCHEIEAVLKAASEAGARRAGYTIVRLPHEVKLLFEEWLRQHYGDRADKVLNHIRQCREGKLNNPEFGKRMTGSGPYVEMIAQRFKLAVKRYGLDNPRTELDFSQFRGGDPQLSLF
jgi:DNA repair photolyase